jgi:CHAT domain-containing protein
MARFSHAVLRWFALPVLALALSGCESHESRTERSLREAALAYPRPVEGRLSVTNRFARWDETAVAHQFDSSPFSNGKEKQVLRGSKPALGKHDPEELHRRGLLELYHGAAARAVARLEVAAERKPSAAILSDLAAAYLALAEDDRPWLQVDAIAAATRAVRQAPDEPYAAFNLALALERMSLAHEATLAWERYLTLQDDSEWHQEASERLARLREPTTSDRWEEEKGRVAAAAANGDRAALARWARRFPGQIKDLIEVELLPAWAQAIGTPTEGARLAAAKHAAESLAGTGERLYIDAINAIESRVAASQALADGHLIYARGMKLRGNCSQAIPDFERALKRLSEGDSPLTWAARFQQLVCLYRRRASDAEEDLANLASKLERLPYPTLLAKTEGMRGLCAMAAGRHSQAVAHYERATQLLTGIGDQDITRYQGMLDEAYRFLGDRDGSWRYRLEALRGAVAAGNQQIRHAVLAGLARDLVETDRREAAGVVLDEMLANAHAWSEAGAAAEALLRRIQLHLRIGSIDQAAADIADCTELLKQYPQSADREHLETELMLASAEQQLATDPAAALSTFQAAVPRLETSGDGLILPRALLGLARARISVGETKAAEEAFNRAIQIYEVRRESTVGEELRISFFSTAQASFDAMIRFQAIERGDAHVAFTYSERMRARALRDRIQAGGRAAEPRSLDEQLDRIPANVAVLAYTVLPKELLVWRLRQSSLTMHVLPTPRSEVEKVVGSLRAALMNSSRKRGERAAAKAFDILLRPALEGLPAETELVFVPDRELHQVSFSALFDASRGRYLIEDHTCLVAPSLDLYLASEHRRDSSPWKPRRVLAIGDPAFDLAQFPDLLPLPAARKEALAVAEFYEDPTPLVGEDATRQRILDELPEKDMLHLAAHVVVDPRNPLGSLVATADPGRTPLRASDFSAERLAGIKLVVLAACDTAPGFTDGNREGVAGLARAFLATGVPAVVATLWAVDDEAAARLTEVFHARLREGDSPARALRLAQIALISEPPSSAPFAWAPFQLFRGR